MVLPFEIESTARQERYIKLLIHGAFGAGKTHFAGTARDVDGMGDVLLLDAESGDKTLSAEDRAVDRIRVTNFATVNAVTQMLREHLRYRDGTRPDDIEKLVKLEQKYRGGKKVTTPRRYRTVIFDSLAEFHKLVMNKRLGIDYDNVELDQEVRDIQWKDWGQASTMIMQMIRVFREMDIHFIAVCPSETKVIEKTGASMTAPMLPGKLSEQVQGQFDVVAYLRSAVDPETKSVGRRLYLEPGKTFRAKHRMGPTTPAWIDNADMADLMEVYNGDSAGTQLLSGSVE